jgi:hypothetical protein
MDCKPFWPPRRHSLHRSDVLNRGYAYVTIISSKYHGQTLLSHLASLYPRSTPQAWQQKLNNGEVTLNGDTATEAISVFPARSAWGSTIGTCPRLRECFKKPL